MAMQKIKEFSLNFLFKISNHPVLLRDLLEANVLFNEDMLIDPAKLNFKMKHLNGSWGCNRTPAISK